MVVWTRGLPPGGPGARAVVALLEAWGRNPEGNEQKFQATPDGVEFVGHVRAWLKHA